MPKEVEHAEFAAKDVQNVLARLSPEEIDGLAFGAIQLDPKGKVLFYSARESAITGRRREDVVGKNFFDDVAPCCNRPEFRGRFQDVVKNGGDFEAVFDYVFDYKMNPTKVSVHMKKALVGETFWVLVNRR